MLFRFLCSEHERRRKMEGHEQGRLLCWHGGVTAMRHGRLGDFSRPCAITRMRNQQL